MDDRLIDLVAENIDAALRLGALTDSSLRARKLAQADRLVVATPGYLAKRGAPSSPCDLLEHDGIIMGKAREDRNGSFGAGLRRLRYAFEPG